MENVEEQILTYPHCSKDRKREIEGFVEGHPEWAPLLRDVRALEAFAQVRPAVGEGQDASEALLATYVTVKHLHPEDISPTLEAAFRRLEERIESDQGLSHRAETMQRRLEAAEAEVDPVAQFEGLTGHSISGSQQRATSSEAASVQSASQSGRTSETSSGPSLIDAFLRLAAPVRWVGATFVLLLGTYGVLYGVSTATQSPLDQLAAIDERGQVMSSYATTNTRGATQTSDTARIQDLYVEALSTLRTARTSTLGLFPAYDADKIARAERLLTDVLEREEPGSFLALEVRFYLGKAYLAQEQVAKARAQFQAVVEGEGRRAEEAQRLLSTLQEVAPTEH